MPKLKAGVIGATGYAGAELVRLLLSHPNVELAAVSSVSYEGKPLSEIYPSLAGCCDALLTNDQAVLQTSDVVFASLPHGHSEPYARACMEQGKVFIDLGADFRLYNEQDYRDWYGLRYAGPRPASKGCIRLAGAVSGSNQKCPAARQPRLLSHLHRARPGPGAKAAIH